MHKRRAEGGDIVANLYEDIITLPHHVSPTRARMSAMDRAAQFSPFAALTGYDSAIKETARLTDKRIDLDDTQKEALSQRLLILSEHIDGHPEASFTYYVPDKKKAGGAYVTATGCVKKIIEHENLVVLMDGRKIAITDIIDIDSELFSLLDRACR